SAAVPPAFSVSIAAAVASGWEVAAIPSHAWTGERPGRWKSRNVMGRQSGEGGGGTLDYDPIFCTGSAFTTGSAAGVNGEGSTRGAGSTRGGSVRITAGAGATTTGACSTTTLRRARRNAAAKPASRSTTQIATNSTKVDVPALSTMTNSAAAPPARTS